MSETPGPQGNAKKVHSRRSEAQSPFLLHTANLSPNNSTNYHLPLPIHHSPTVDTPGSRAYHTGLVRPLFHCAIKTAKEINLVIYDIGLQLHSKRNAWRPILERRHHHGAAAVLILVGKRVADVGVQPIGGFG